MKKTNFKMTKRIMLSAALAITLSFGNTIMAGDWSDDFFKIKDKLKAKAKDLGQKTSWNQYLKYNSLDNLEINHITLTMFEELSTAPSQKNPKKKGKPATKKQQSMMGGLPRLDWDDIKSLTQNWNDNDKLNALNFFIGEWYYRVELDAQELQTLQDTREYLRKKVEENQWPQQNNNTQGPQQNNNTQGPQQNNGGLSPSIIKPNNNDDRDNLKY